MAVQRNRKDTMTAKVITSVSASGTPTLSPRTMSYLNPVLTDDEVFTLGTTWAGFCKYETDSINRKQEYELAAE